METRATIRIQAAGDADAAAIREVAVRTWRATYAGLIAEADVEVFLDWNYSEANIGRSIGRLGAGYLVAVDGEAIVGYTMAGANREGGGEVFAIYVLPEYHGRGVGYALWQGAMEHLRGAGFAEGTLWVAAGNTSARRFYERQGGVVIGKRVDEIGGSYLAEVRYRFDLSSPSA